MVRIFHRIIITIYEKEYFLKNIQSEKREFISVLDTRAIYDATRHGSLLVAASDRLTEANHMLSIAP